MKTGWMLSSVVTLLAMGINAQGATVHVNAGSTNPVVPYAGWATAATNIQEGVNAATNAGDIVLVTNGVYSLPAQISVTRGITVRSVNGAAVTTVDGRIAVRCFNITHADAVVEGFTITRGRAYGDLGGGVYGNGGGTLRNCTVIGNQGTYGAGVALRLGGTVENCQIISNTVVGTFTSNGEGGGVRCDSGGIVRNCLIRGSTHTLWERDWRRRPAQVWRRR
jgi:hypothetical protein